MCRAMRVSLLPAAVLLARGLTTQCALAQICDDSAARGNPAKGNHIYYLSLL